MTWLYADAVLSQQKLELTGDFLYDPQYVRSVLSPATTQPGC